MNDGRGLRRRNCSQARRKNRVAVKHAGLNVAVEVFELVGVLNQNFSVTISFGHAVDFFYQRVSHAEIICRLPRNIASQTGTFARRARRFGFDGNFPDA